MSRGVLTAVVLALPERDTYIYVSHAGAQQDLLLDADIAPGDDWRDANVYVEERVPLPPGSGLWQMILPWRTPVGADAGQLVGGPDLADLCCVYPEPPQWIRIDEPMQDALRYQALLREGYVSCDLGGALYFGAWLDANVHPETSSHDLPWLTSLQIRGLLEAAVSITDPQVITAGIDYHLRGVPHV